MSETSVSGSVSDDGRGEASGGTTGATIELEALTKRYPGSPQPAVENVSMEIKAGETVIFVGPRAAGSPPP